jgi:hypothetical protein
VAVWIIYLKGCMGGLHSACDVHAFHLTIIVQYGESVVECSRFHYHAQWRHRSIRFTYETNGKIFYYYFHFLFVIFYKYIYLQATVLRREPSLMKFFVETHA